MGVTDGIALLHKQMNDWMNSWIFNSIRLCLFRFFFLLIFLSQTAKTYTINFILVYILKYNMKWWLIVFRIAIMLVWGFVLGKWENYDPYIERYISYQGETAHPYDVWCMQVQVYYKWLRWIWKSRNLNPRLSTNLLHRVLMLVVYWKPI